MCLIPSYLLVNKLGVQHHMLPWRVSVHTDTNLGQFKSIVFSIMLNIFLFNLGLQVQQGHLTMDYSLELYGFYGLVSTFIHSYSSTCNRMFLVI